MDSPKPSLSTRDITFTAVGIALISVSAWVTVPIGPVPFTLQTMALAFVLVAMSPVQSTLAVMLYLVLGAAGLPLFSGMRGGVGVLLSPTGGFLIGFALAALAALVIRRVMDDSPARDVVVVVALIVCSYVFGWAWLMRPLVCPSSCLTSSSVRLVSRWPVPCAVPFPILPRVAPAIWGQGVLLQVRHACIRQALHCVEPAFP